MPLVVILADGKSKPQHLDNRYFLKIGKEELLPRTIRQFSAWATVWVATNDPVIAGKVKGTRVVKPWDLSKSYHGIDMIRKGLTYAASQQRTIIVFGDVYFTDDAVAKIKEGNDMAGSRPTANSSSSAN